MRDPAQTGCAIVLIYGVVFALAIAASYWMASICEPQALWWWRDILGILPADTCR